MSLAPSPAALAAVRPLARAATSIQCLDTTTVVYLAGELDLSTLDEERRTLARGIALDLPVVVDLSGVVFMDAATVGLLVRSTAFLHVRGRSLTIRQPSTFAARVLSVCGLDDLVADGPPHLVVVDRAEP